MLDTNPLRARIGNGRIIQIMNANFCILYFYFSLETEPEAPRSETLVAGLGLVLAILQPEIMTVYAGYVYDTDAQNLHRLSPRSVPDGSAPFSKVACAR